MLLIKSFGIVISLAVAGAGTMALAQATLPVMAPTGPAGNNPHYSAAYNATTSNTNNPANAPLNGFTYGPDIYSVDASSAEAQQQRLKAAEQDRKLNEDIDKLLAVMKQLKTAVDTPTSAQPSADLAKKAGEIEKLAKSIQTQKKS